MFESKKEGNSQKPNSKKIKSENLDSVVDKLYKVIMASGISDMTKS